MDLPQTQEVPKCLFRIRGAWWDQTRNFLAPQIFQEGLVHSTPGFWFLSLFFLSSPVLKEMLWGHIPTRSLPSEGWRRQRACWQACALSTLCPQNGDQVQGRHYQTRSLGLLSLSVPGTGESHCSFPIFPRSPLQHCLSPCLPNTGSHGASTSKSLCLLL